MTLHIIYTRFLYDKDVPLVILPLCLQLSFGWQFSFATVLATSMVLKYVVRLFLIRVARTKRKTEARKMVDKNLLAMWFLARWIVW